MSIDKDLAKAQAEWEKSKETAAQFGTEIPVGVYEGVLTTLGLAKSQTSGTLQVKREITISDGEYKGAIARDYNGVTNDIGLAILRKFIEMCGYEAPENIVELPATLEAIQNEAPSVRFSYTERNGFRSIRPLEISPSGDAAPANDDTATADDTEAADGSGDADAAATELLDKAKAFGVAQGIDVEDSDDLDAVKGKIGGYLFPVAGVKPEQLKDNGFEDPSEVTVLTDEDVALLTELGCEDSILNPDPKYDKPKAAPKAAPKASPKVAAKAAPAKAKAGAAKKR